MTLAGLPQNPDTYKESRRCFFGFHAWGKWSDITIKERTIKFNPDESGQMLEVLRQVKICSRCGYSQERLL